MIKRRNFKDSIICALAGAGLLLFMPVSHAEEFHVSGYLAPETYEKMQELEVAEGVKVRRWVGEKLNRDNYQAVIVEDVTFYPEPQAGPQVSEETLEKTADYLSGLLREKLASVATVTDTAGPGVLRLQMAVTGVSVKTEGMKAYEVVPVAAIFGGIKAATGTRDREVFVFAEAKITDSESGELVGAAMRRIQGKNLKGKQDELELEDLKGNLDEAGNHASEFFGSAMSAGTE